MCECVLCFGLFCVKITNYWKWNVKHLRWNFELFLHKLLKFKIILTLGFFWFYARQTIVVHLMPNHVSTYVLNIWFVNILCRYTQLNDQTVLFQAIQIIISHLRISNYMSKSSIWPIDRIQPGATNLDQSGSGSDGNEGVLCIPKWYFWFGG